MGREPWARPSTRLSADVRDLSPCSALCGPRFPGGREGAELGRVACRVSRVACTPLGAGVSLLLSCSAHRVLVLPRGSQAHLGVHLWPGAAGSTSLLTLRRGTLTPDPACVAEEGPCKTEQRLCRGGVHGAVSLPHPFQCPLPPTPSPRGRARQSRWNRGEGEPVGWASGPRPGTGALPAAGPSAVPDSVAGGFHPAVPPPPDPHSRSTARGAGHTGLFTFT